jgi:hypothetical protein
MLNSIEEDGPVAASPPHLALVASAAADWSTKTARGREIRLALELVGRSDDPAQTAALALRVEQRIATLAPQQSGFAVVRCAHALRCRPPLAQWRLDPDPEQIWQR